jgi:hypothetical protein
MDIYVNILIHDMTAFMFQNSIEILLTFVLLSNVWYYLIKYNAITYIQNAFINISWNTFVKISKYRLLYHTHIETPLNKYIFNPISNFMNIELFESYRIFFIHNGKVNLKYKHKKHIDNQLFNLYDFILFHPKCGGSMILRSKTDIPDVNDVDKSILKTNVKFLCAQINVKLYDRDLSIAIDLHHYILNGNIILDYSFVNWYCKYYLFESFHFDDVIDYTIHLLDLNVTNVVIKDTQQLKINENGYIIEDNSLHLNLDELRRKKQSILMKYGKNKKTD